MKTCLNVTTLLVLLTMASGCSKFRELTRRDYALLRDPFAARKGESESTPPVDAAQTTSGYVKLGDTAGQTADSVKADYSTVTQTQPATQPNGTGFSGIRVRGMGDSIAPESDPKSSSAALARLNAPRPKSADAQSAGNESTGSATVAGTSDSADSGFADWASTKIQRWKTDTATATKQTNPIRQVSKTVERSANDAAEKASAFITRAPEKAEPFIKPNVPSPEPVKQELLKRKTAATKQAPVQPPPVDSPNPFAELEPKVAPSTPAVSDPQSPAASFDDLEVAAPSAASEPTPGSDESANPFADFENAPSKPAMSKPTTSKTLDDSFNFDTGWRPADAKIP